MNIGIVTTWFERGGAYVSRAYMDNLTKMGHTVFIYARGGESMGKDDAKWNLPNVTWGKVLRGGNVNKKHFFKWIDEKKLEVVFFNEQANFRIVCLTKLNYPDIKLGSYIDYYTEKLIPYYSIYDFVICNTNRHMQAMEKHPQKFYLRWGTNTKLFRPQNYQHKKITFFHSVGMSNRKGTDVLLDAYIDGQLYKRSKLIIHTQIPIENVSNYSSDQLEKYDIEIIEKTVTAPGLYYLGDIYVYPTRLDGLGLTMYEALACGMPVITTDYPPMNEIIDDSVGKLVKVERNYSRADAYYWPMSICDKKSLIRAMEFYIDNKNELNEQKKRARCKAIEFYEWEDRAQELSDIFEKSKIRNISEAHIYEVLKEFDKGTFRNWARENEFVTTIYERIRKR